jgi:hypothetical protein
MKKNQLAGFDRALMSQRFAAPRFLAASLLSGCLSLIVVQAGASETDTCSESLTIESSAQEPIKSERMLEEARATALRRALIDAMQRGTGIEVATSSRSVTTSTLRSIDLETTDKTVLRAKGRLKSWSIVRDEIVTGPDAQESIELLVKAEVCISPDYRAPVVVAFGDLILPGDYQRPHFKDRLAEAFPPSELIKPTMGSPDTTYYDVLVDAIVSVNLEIIDNTAKIAVLERFRSGAATTSLPPGFKRVTVTVVAKAARFFDDLEIFEIVERRRQVGLDVDPSPAVAPLIDEALSQAAEALHARLVEAEL